MTATKIGFVGTESFYNNYSSESSSNKRGDIRTYVENKWRSFIEDGSGQYEAKFIEKTASELTVPDSTLPDNNSLSDRREAADDWLKGTSVYSNVDSVLVIDWYGEDNYTYGYAWIGTAGTYENQACIVDCWWEDNDALPAEWHLIDSEGIGLHEVMHTYNAHHPEDVSTSSTGYWTLMWSNDGVGCRDNGSADQVATDVSTCTENALHYYIETQL